MDEIEPKANPLIAPTTAPVRDQPATVTGAHHAE
jgi:hypothetical protein